MTARRNMQITSSQAQQTQTQQPTCLMNRTEDGYCEYRCRFAIPPPQLMLARLRALTLYAGFMFMITARKLCGNVRLEQGYDPVKRWEYVELAAKCGCNADLRQVIQSEWGIRDLDDFWTRIAPTTFDETSQELRIADTSGRIPPPGFYRNCWEEVLRDPSTYPHGRGITVERVKASSGFRPSTGYINISIGGQGGAQSFLYMLCVGVEPVKLKLPISGGKTLNAELLLLDIGDGEYGLKEAFEKLYGEPRQVKSQSGTRLRIEPALDVVNLLRTIVNSLNTMNIEFPQIAHLLLVAWITREVLRGGIELLPRWPSLALVTYGETRNMRVTVVSPDDVFAAAQGLKASAEALGVSTVDLADFLIQLLECSVRALQRGVRGVDAVLAKYPALLDSAIRGVVDRDLFYSVVRSVAGNRDYAAACSSALRKLT